MWDECSSKGERQSGLLLEQSQLSMKEDANVATWQQCIQHNHWLPQQYLFSSSHPGFGYFAIMRERL
ncbi:hypothetical protein O3M35_006271 [Rhynocoris fuscipes]|uniref:Uncharacterized protein n=1 Tax=Rhynocoris fuscipes TaxID=488301 RepID=A0AAW1DCT9_9HEMI